jgi:N-acetylglutamate synthase-like GNAT family acetyltransferase
MRAILSGCSQSFSSFCRCEERCKTDRVIGLEVINMMGLVGSLAVAPSFRGKGIAKELYSRILAYAHLKGIMKLYLLTLTAEGFFSKLGFNKVDRNNVPAAIQSTEEFRSLCPATAVCMVKNIENEPHYYPKEILRLNPYYSEIRLR